MAKYRVEFEETTQRVAIVYASTEQEARDKVSNRQEDDNYEDPAPIRQRQIFDSALLPECDC